MSDNLSGFQRGYVRRTDPMGGDVFDKGSDKGASGDLDDFTWRANLFNHALVEDGYTVCQIESLVLLGLPVGREMFILEER